MAIQPRQWLRNRLRRRSHAEWHRLLSEVKAMNQRQLRVLQDEARTLRRLADRFVARAQHRLDIPNHPQDVPDLPGGTDWRWRPRLFVTTLSPSGIAAPPSGSRFGDDATVWHDSEDSPPILRQIRNRNVADLTPFGLSVETFGYTGSYLSLAIELPPTALQGLTRSHIIRLDINLNIERPMNFFSRLNIGHGPNTDDIIRQVGELPLGEDGQTVTVEFDLYYVGMNEKRLEKLWLDLIFEQPHMNSIRIRDIFLSRHLRADL